MLTLNKALIVYGTRFGAAASTSEEVAKILRQQGLAVKVVNAKEEQVKDVAEYDIIIVGSGIQINRWTSEPEKFLKTFQKQLTKKKVALFVCCGSASQAINDESQTMDKMKMKYLDEKAAKYNLRPIALGFFGGIYNYNKVPWWAKKVLNAERSKIAAAYKEVQSNIYDTRDWAVIHSWAKQLAQTINS